MIVCVLKYDLEKEASERNKVAFHREIINLNYILITCVGINIIIRAKNKKLGSNRIACAEKPASFCSIL